MGSASNTPPPEQPVRIGQFITTASDAIPAAGLLTAKPELLEAEMTPSDWADELAAYGQSERP